MFTVKLDLVGYELSGLEALDVARRFGLPDTSRVLFTSSRMQKGAHQPQCEVGEAFARAYFGEKQTGADSSVPYRMLAKGDVRLACEGNSSAVTFAELTPQRIQELYLAVRFQACRDQVERLQARIDELEAAREAQWGDDRENTPNNR
jgi:hypothetical protein